MLASEGAAQLGDGQAWVMLWLLLTALVLLGAVARGRLAAPLAKIDLAVLALIGWHTIAALAAVRTGSPRPSVNMLWEWVGLGAGYFCVRQAVPDGQQSRALVAVMLALAAGLSVLGYEQYFIAQPAERAAYARDPEGTLASAGHWAPSGSPQRRLFEERLESKEPLAGFALTNSLAGLLVPWLLVALAIAAEAQQQAMRSALGPIVSALLIAGCLLLTKSRSGYMAVAAGIGLAVCLSPRTRRWWTGRRIVIFAGATLLLIALAVAARGLDIEVLSQAGRSLGYRFHYWQATWAMICDHPWLGCGPGNFQDNYTLYKLPQASEEVQDPHNFLLEIWATAGTPAALAMLLVLAGLAWRVLRAARKPEASAASEVFAGEPSGRAGRWAAGGGLAGLLVAYALGPLVGLPFGFDRVLLVGISGLAACWSLERWTRSGILRPEWRGVAAAAQCVNHLAAGGIGFPGVAGSFWLLLGLTVNGTQHTAPAEETRREPAQPPSERPRLLPIVGLVAALVAAGCCYLTAYGPVLRCQTALARAASAETAAAGEGREHTAATVEQDLEQAAAADPLASEPCRWLADYELQRWLSNRDPQARRRFAAAADAFVHLRPQASAAWQQLGQWYLSVYAASGQAADARQAAGYFQRAVERYPTGAALWAELAQALLAAGDQPAARRAAGQALRLDALEPAGDKQIGAEQRKRMQDMELGSR